ncbi:unnamed protein product [Lathyrus oleraceus]
MVDPCSIYDHCLIVIEWIPNFHLDSDQIEKVAVYVRFSGLGIEYYETKVLIFTANIIGRIMKVDQNTILQE